jgi:hypothetical protein
LDEQQLPAIPDQQVIDQDKDQEKQEEQVISTSNNLQLTYILERERCEI